MKPNYYFTIILVFMLFSVCEKVNAQAPDWLWAKSEGDSSSEWATGLATDASGNSYVTGIFVSATVTFGNIVLTNVSPGYGGDIFMAKFDAGGNVVWAKSAGGIYDDDGWNSIAVDANGNSYVTGSFNSPVIIFGNDTLTQSGGGSEMFIAKLDANGNPVWARSAGAANGYSIATDQTGNSYVVGSFSSSTITFGNTVLTNTGASYSNDVFIVKYDSSGTALWAKSAGGSSDDFGAAIALDAMGNSYITGSYYSPSITFGGTVLTNASPTVSTPDMFTVKYNATGNVVWAKSVIGIGYQYGRGIAVDASSNVYVTGHFDNVIIMGTIILNTAYGDVLTMKLDTSGNAVWAKAGGGTGSADGLGIALDTMGNSYVTGTFNNTKSFGSTTLTSAGGVDAFVVKYDTAGTALWAKDAGGLGNDQSRGIATETSGSCYITGTFGSPNMAFDSINITKVGGTDMFIARLSLCQTSSTDSVITCNSYASPSGNYVWTVSGIYNDTIPNAGGCDSVITINLVINSTSSTQTDTACSSYTSPSGNYVWTASGVYIDTIPNSAGCDSIITTNLSVNSTSSAQTITACNSYTSPSGNYVWTASGTYNDTIPNAAACDSVITINLTINAGTSSAQTITACSSYTSPSGNYVWTTSGVYLDTIPNSLGCDSVITINLTVNTVDTSVTQTGNVLSANSAGTVYQWLDCNNGFSIISGATSQTFAPASIGNYAVAITQNGCVDTSSCYTVIGVGINEAHAAGHFIISPNPVNDILIIRYTSFVNKTATVTITDVRGTIVYQNNSPAFAKTEINTKDFSAGVYFVQVKTADYIETGKVMVEQ